MLHPTSFEQLSIGDFIVAVRKGDRVEGIIIGFDQVARTVTVETENGAHRVCRYEDVAAFRRPSRRAA